MQGKLDVSSAEGKGTTFTVLLPLKVTQKIKEIIPKENQQELSLSSTKEDIPINHIKTKHILLYVDNKKVREDISSKLKYKDINIIKTNDEKESLELSKKIQPDLILIDSITSKNNSFALLTALKNNEKTSRIPIIFLTPKQMIQNKFNYFETISNQLIMIE